MRNLVPQQFPSPELHATTNGLSCEGAQSLVPHVTLFCGGVGAQFEPLQSATGRVVGLAQFEPLQSATDFGSCLAQFELPQSWAGFGVT